MPGFHGAQPPDTGGHHSASQVPQAIAPLKERHRQVLLPFAGHVLGLPRSF